MLRRRVALKRVHAEGDANAILRLRREALVGASLSHPNLVSVYDVQMRADGDLVIVMEYVAGRDAARRDRRVGRPAARPGPRGADGCGFRARRDPRAGHRPPRRQAGEHPARAGGGDQAGGPGNRAGRRSDADHAGRHGPRHVQLHGARAARGDGIDPGGRHLRVGGRRVRDAQRPKARPQTNPVALAHAIATQPPPDLCAVVPDVPRAAAEVLRRGMDPDPERRPRSATDLVDRPARGARAGGRNPAGHPVGPPSALRPAPAAGRRAAGRRRNGRPSSVAQERAGREPVAQERASAEARAARNGSPRRGPPGAVRGAGWGAARGGAAGGRGAGWRAGWGHRGWCRKAASSPTESRRAAAGRGVA